MIRVASHKDIESINELGKLIDTNFSNLFLMSDYLKEKYNIILVNTENNDINGFLLAQDLGDNIDLLAIAVNETAQGKKIGTNMLKYLITNYANNKTITLEVAINNEKALGLYQKLGFKVENIRKSYYNNIDAYLMKWREK